MRSNNQITTSPPVGKSANVTAIFVSPNGTIINPRNSSKPLSATFGIKAISIDNIQINDRNRPYNPTKAYEEKPTSIGGHLKTLWIISIAAAIALTLLRRPKFDRSAVVSYRKPDELEQLFSERKRRYHEDQHPQLVRQQHVQEKAPSRIEKEFMLLKKPSLQVDDTFPAKKIIRKVSL
uniref:Transmembrane protein n=1 Tax=Rhabditophanes sp. KR3021 TaxID=114890 RepID=A0AC35UB98_9BILA